MSENVLEKEEKDRRNECCTQSLCATISYTGPQVQRAARPLLFSAAGTNDFPPGLFAGARNKEARCIYTYIRGRALEISFAIIEPRAHRRGISIFPRLTGIEGLSGILASHSPSFFPFQGYARNETKREESFNRMASRRLIKIVPVI